LAVLKVDRLVEHLADSQVFLTVELKDESKVVRMVAQKAYLWVVC